MKSYYSKDYILSVVEECRKLSESSLADLKETLIKIVNREIELEEYNALTKACNNLFYAQEILTPLIKELAFGLSHVKTEKFDSSKAMMDYFESLDGKKKTGGNKGSA